MKWFLYIPYVLLYLKLIKNGLSNLNAVEYQLSIFCISFVCTIFFYNQNNQRGVIQKAFDKIMLLITGTCTTISFLCIMNSVLIQSIIGPIFYFLFGIFFNLDKFNGVKIDLPGESFDFIDVIDHFTIATTNPSAYVILLFYFVFNTISSILFFFINSILSYFGIIMNLGENTNFVFNIPLVVLNKTVDNVLRSSTLVSSLQPSIELDPSLNSTIASQPSSLSEVTRLLYDTGICFKKNTYSALFRDISTSASEWKIQQSIQSLKIMNSNCLSEARKTASNDIKVSSIFDTTKNVAIYFASLFSTGFKNLPALITIIGEFLYILKQLIIQKFSFTVNLKSSSSFLLVNKLQVFMKIMIPESLLSFLVKDYFIVIPAIFVLIVSLISIINKQFPAIGSSIYNNRWLILRLMNGTFGFIWLIDLLQRLYLTSFSNDFNLSVFLNVGIGANLLVVILFAYIDFLIPSSVYIRRSKKQLNHFTEDFMLLYTCGWLYIASREIKDIIVTSNVCFSCSVFILVFVIRKEAYAYYSVDVIMEALKIFGELLSISIRLLGKLIASSYKIFIDATTNIYFMMKSILQETFNGGYAIIMLVLKVFFLAYEVLKSLGKFLERALKPLIYKLYDTTCYGIEKTCDYLNILIDAVFSLGASVLKLTFTAVKYCYDTLLWTAWKTWKHLMVPVGQFLFGCGQQSLILLQNGLIGIYKVLVFVLKKLVTVSESIFDAACYIIQKTYYYLMTAVAQFGGICTWIAEKIWICCLVPLGENLYNCGKWLMRIIIQLLDLICQVITLILFKAFEILNLIFDTICYGIEKTCDYLNILIDAVFNLVANVLKLIFTAVKYCYDTLLWTAWKTWKHLMVPVGQFLFGCGQQSLILLQNGLIGIYKVLVFVLKKLVTVSESIFDAACYIIQKTYYYLMTAISFIGDCFDLIIQETWKGIMYFYPIMLKLIHKILVCIRYMIMSAMNLLLLACYYLVETVKIVIDVAVIRPSVWFYLEIVVPLCGLLVGVIIWFRNTIKKLAKLTIEVLKATYGYTQYIIQKSLGVLKQVLLFILECLKPLLNFLLCCWFSVSLVVCGSLCLKHAVGDSKLGLLLGGYTNVLLGVIFLCKSILDNVLPPINNNDQSIRGKAHRLLTASLNITLKVCLTLYAYLDFYFIPLLTILTTKVYETVCYVIKQTLTILKMIVISITHIGLYLKSAVYTVVSLLFDGFGSILKVMKKCISVVFFIVIKGILIHFAKTMGRVLKSIWNNPFSGLFASLGVILVAYYAHKGVIDFKALFMLLVQLVGAKQESFLSCLLYLSNMKYYVIEFYGYLKSMLLSIPSSQSIYLKSHTIFLDFIKYTCYVVIGAISISLKFLAKETKVFVYATGIEGIATNSTLAWVVYVLNVVLLRLLIWDKNDRLDVIENNIYLIRSTMKILFIPVLILRVLLGHIDLSMILKSPIYIMIGYVIFSFILIIREAIQRRDADVNAERLRAERSIRRPVIQSQNVRPQNVRPQNVRPQTLSEQKPLSVSFIENLKSSGYKRPNRIFEKEECPICIETFTDDMSNPLSTQVYYLQCGHGLHDDCIKLLIESKQRETKCPECRNSIFGGRNIFL